MKTFKNKIGNETVIFAETFELEAMEQVVKMSNFEPYLNEKVRIMPDAHAGKGCTVGATMTISDKVTPNLVGVDIGCGMLTVKLGGSELDLEMIDNIIKKYVPCGFNVHKTVQKDFDLSGLVCGNYVDIERSKLSIGSLGGGNHFIEISHSELTGDYYLIIHSGSRKLGGDVCKHYQDRAIKSAMNVGEKANALIEKLKSEKRENEIEAEVSKIKRCEIEKDLCYLEGVAFEDYMNDMFITQKFASKNRETIADIIIREAGLTEVERFETIHNYIDFTRMILRKGAVSSEYGEKLLIPINMRDGSLLCTGKGNENWNYSAPHGSGRLMSRTKAKNELSMSEFKESMSEVYTTSVSESTLDEAPMAYKPINEIVSAITDTVDVIEVLKPVYNFKAH